MNKNNYQNQELNLAYPGANKRLLFALLSKKLISFLICLQLLISPFNAISFALEDCKNYTDCNYKDGEFCVNKDGKNICQNVCPLGKVAPGLDNNGDSLPCPADLTYSGVYDLSGRRICCPKKKQYTEEKKEEKVQLQKVQGKLCKGSDDCKESEFCAYTESSEARCGIYNCDGAYTSKLSCPKSELLLAQGPEGYFCCPLIYKGERKSSSGGQESSSSGGSSSGGNKKKKQSSSGAPQDYGVNIVLQTPEILQGKAFGQNKAIPLLFKASSGGVTSSSSGAASKPVETHLYRPGEKVSFAVFVKGPPLSKPQDISSYTLSVIANQKDSTSKPASLKVLELWVEDIVSSIDLTDLLSNPPPLNIALIKQDSKKSFKAVIGETFMLQLPETRYLSNGSGRLVLAIPADTTKPIEENKCSLAGGSVCGSENIGVANCITNTCFKFPKASQFAKNCCKGILEDDVDEVAVSSSGSVQMSSSSSGEVTVPKPTCKKETKEIECKITNKYYVPYCANRNIPSCSDEGKPVCKSVSSSGAILDEVPVCLLNSKTSEEYCKDVSMLLPVNGFDPSACINDYCSSSKSLEDKKTCCVVCGKIYEAIKNPKIEYSEVSKITSCIGFDGGYCGSIKNAQACLDGQCYNHPQNSSEVKICCSKYDKNAGLIKALLTEGGEEEERGMIYNVISVNGGSLKVKKSIEDIIGQNFEIQLPSDPSITSITLKASIKDKKGKVKDSEVNILLLNGDNLQNEENNSENNEKPKEQSPEKDSPKLNLPKNSDEVKNDLKDVNDPESNKENKNDDVEDQKNTEKNTEINAD